MSAATVTVDLVALPTKGAPWHVLALPGREVALCGLGVSSDGLLREDGLDARVVSHRGRRVCVLCRRRLK